MAIDVQSIQKMLHRVNENRIFQFVVIAVIILSSLLIGFKTFEGTANYKLLIFLDYAVTAFFLFEIVIRFLATENKKAFFKSGWNIFDTLIVAVSLIPISNSEYALLGRLIRIFRVLRLITVIPELKKIVESLLRSMKAVGYVSLLLFIIFYMYAAVGSFMFDEINEDLWGNVLDSLLTLFRIMTLEDWTDIMYETMAVYWWSWIYYVSFIMLTVYTLLNVLVAAIVGDIMESAQKRRDEAAKKDSVAK